MIFFFYFFGNKKGFSVIAENLKVIPGTVQECSTILKGDNILAIAPGGVYEAQFGDSYYHLMWKNRLGFAKAAIEAKKVNEKKKIFLIFFFKKKSRI